MECKMDARTRAPYRCAASAVVATERAFGQVTVHETSVTFEPRGAFNSMFAVGVVGRIVHTQRELVLVRARLRPPRVSTALHLIGDPDLGQGTPARVQLASRNRGALTDALLRAGYDLDQHITWFSLSVAPR
jgi:hypothetical protein